MTPARIGDIGEHMWACGMQGPQPTLRGAGGSAAAGGGGGCSAAEGVRGGAREGHECAAAGEQPSHSPPPTPLSHLALDVGATAFRYHTDLSFAFTTLLRRSCGDLARILIPSCDSAAVRDL